MASVVTKADEDEEVELEIPDKAHPDWVLQLDRSKLASSFGRTSRTPGPCSTAGCEIAALLGLQQQGLELLWPCSGFQDMSACEPVC